MDRDFAEKLPVTEALELKQGLEDTQVPVGGIILNRMPDFGLTVAEVSRLNEHLVVRRHSAL